MRPAAETHFTTTGAFGAVDFYFAACAQMDFFLIFTIQIFFFLKMHHDGHIVFSKVAILNPAVHTVTMT